MEKLSIIVPVYNTYPYLRQCLESIINQTYKNLEIIIVNDASPYIEDDEICKEYAQKDERIIYIKHVENKFQGGARNTGIEKATGKYITFVDSDDYLKEKYVYERCIDNFSRNDDINVLMFHYDLLKNGKIIKKDKNEKDIVIKDYTEIRVDPEVWNKIFLIEDFKKYNLYFKERIKFEDLEFWFRYIVNVKPSLFVINRSFYVYRQHKSSTMRNKANFIHDYFIIFDIMLEYYNNNKKETIRLCILNYIEHIKNITEILEYKSSEEYQIFLNRISQILEHIKIREDEFIKYLGFEFYQYLFYNKYVYMLFQETKKHIHKKRIKYVLIQENIIFYKIKRCIKRIFKKIGGILKWKN